MNSPTLPRRVAATRLLRAVAIAAAATTCAASVLADSALPACAAEPRPAHAVVHWNSIAGEAFAPSQGTNPMAQSRTLAILHAAIHDSLNAIDRRYASYTPGLPTAPQASVDAAVAAAAREVLVQLLPDRAAFVEAAYAHALAPVGDAPARSAGIAIGQAIAQATLRRRDGDGAESAAQPAYVPGSASGEYRFTAPFTFAAQPGWGRVRPFVIDLRQHALDGPLPLDSARYARDLAEIKALGRVDSTTRSAEQSEIARFWYEDSPLGWNRIANSVVRERGLDEWQAARAFALVHFAMADGFIAGFDAKYRHRFWRPVTAIHAAADDGNRRTEADPAWQPLLVTPPVPDYPSTHTVLGWAAAEVLIELFGDSQRFSLTSLTLPGVSREYRGFSQAAQENGLSRLYAGIHFRHAVEHGRRQGRSVGKAVAVALPPLH
ncbi:MAG TPA: vanadium-dependent haloperoxidase [Caldimonas sp.]|jgi:hypothetical protein|nr:vanadium-dependent haloperoxidase [Caldimonas sp.]HEX2541073.1 vanadium-dependent haloperoxidase [Caldimonas sp.]